jgi:hypothetical protein
MDVSLRLSGVTPQYCEGMPESRNSGIGSEVDFLGNELLKLFDDNS